MLASKTTLKEINEKNCHFWEEQRVLLAEWMANDVLRTTAFELMNDESRRDVPLRSRQSILRRSRGYTTANSDRSSAPSRQGP